jgi:hypothetical protein
MSTPETLANIFFDPGTTFEALRARPRFLVAALMVIASFMAFYLVYMQRVGYDAIVDAEVAVMRKANPNVTEEQAAQGARIQKSTLIKTIRMFGPIIGIAVVLAAGGGLYLLGVVLMGGTMSYRQALAVWTYSSFPPPIIMAVLNFVLLFLSPPEDAAGIAQGAQRGLAHANLGAFVDGNAHPVLATGLGALDILSFYGIFLAALGLRKVSRLNSGSAWAVVLVLWGIGVLGRLGVAAATGRAV